MGQGTQRKISQKRAKRDFNTVGLVLILYILFVMVFPYVFRISMVMDSSSILDDEFIYYGLYCFIIVFGTLVPFFLLRKMSRIKLKRLFRMASVTFSDLFVQTLVLFTVCIALTYVSNILIQFVQLDGKLIASIGFSYSEDLNNVLYVFMLIIVTPILEEYAFRGVLLKALSKYGRTFALIATSVIYALAHNNFAEMLPAFAMSYILGKYSIRYRSIQPTILIHILFNTFMYGLCVLPGSITRYIAYALVVIFILALYLILTQRYEMIKIQKSISNRITNNLFYSRFTIVLSMILMIVYTILRTFVEL